MPANPLNLVDSSGWIEFFTDGPSAGAFADPLSDASRLVVPSVSVYEVFRVVLRGAARTRRYCGPRMSVSRACPG